MASTEQRVAALARELLNPDRAPDFDLDFSDAEIPSMDAIAFAKALAKEFDCEIPPEDFAELKNLHELVAYLETNA